VNAVFRHIRGGAFELISNAAKSGTKIRILLPLPQFNRALLAEVTKYIDKNIQFRTLDRMVETPNTFAVVDGKKALVLEIKDDTKLNFDDAILLAILTYSPHVVSSYNSIFAILWRQTELNEQIREQNLQLQRKNEELNKLKLQMEIHDKIQTEFINIAAHELRTPTQSIVGYCEMMENHPQNMDEYIHRLKRSAERLFNLSSDILDVSRIESGTLKLNKTRFDITESINQYISDMRKRAAQESIIFDFRMTDPIFIEADKQRIEQVLNNLLDNALKFTSSGTITIDVSKNESSSQAVITIKDTGTGIDPELYPKLFQKFATKSTRGTGLGLFICKGIIESHGGRIKGENNHEGCGSTFSFSIPTV